MAREVVLHTNGEVKSNSSTLQPHELALLGKVAVRLLEDASSFAQTSHTPSSFREITVSLRSKDRVLECGFALSSAGTEIRVLIRED